MTQNIIIYDPVTRLPKYTVEFPYPEETLAFYQDLVAGDSSLALILSEDSDIRDKCIIEDGEDFVLGARPEQTLTGELVGNIFTINGLQPFSKIMVDRNDIYDLEDQTTLNITLSTYGTYELLIMSPPYLDYLFTVEYGPDTE